MARILATLFVLLALSGVARADHLCRVEPAPPTDGPLCTAGGLDDDPSCRGAEPRHPLPPVVQALADKTGAAGAVLPGLGGPGVILLGRWRGEAGDEQPGHHRRIDRPPRA